MTESELLDYNDTLVDFTSLIMHYGASRVLMDLQSSFPELFDEIKTQIVRFPKQPVAALLRK
jgi:hypothetical protein